MEKKSKVRKPGVLTESIGCCKVESLLTIDERGQMVLPKEIRDRANIRAGDKLALVTWGKGEENCCFTLIKVDELGEMVKELLGPMMKEMMTR